MTSTCIFSLYTLLFRDTPDTVISSSSPECSLMENDTDFTCLRPIDPASSGGTTVDRYSPVAPLLCPLATYPCGKAKHQSIEISSSVIDDPTIQVLKQGVQMSSPMSKVCPLLCFLASFPGYLYDDCYQNTIDSYRDFCII